MYQAALAVEIVKSKESLLNDTFGKSNRESPLSGAAQVRHILPKSVCDDAYVRTMPTLRDKRVVEMRAVLETLVIRIGRFNGFEAVQFANKSIQDARGSIDSKDLHSDIFYWVCVPEVVTNVNTTLRPCIHGDSLERLCKPDAGITGPTKLSHDLKFALLQLLSQRQRIIPKTLLRSKHMRFFIAHKFFAIVVVPDPNAAR